MLPANVVSALHVLSHTGRPLVTPTVTPPGKEAPRDATRELSKDATAATAAPKQTGKLEPGQELQGLVQSRTSENVFKVQVAGQLLQMRLPGNIQPGDAIRLQVLSVQPKITFGMVASTNPLSTPEQIGSAARMFSNLADLPMNRPLVQQLGNKAVWPAAQQMPDTKLLAGALKEALGKSGLFYESHQAQWIRGERSTNQLLEEPQNLLTGRGLPFSPTGQRVPGGDISAAQAQGAALAYDKAAASQVQSNISAAGRVADDASTSLQMTKELIPLVQQQLHTLEHHHMVWMGQVWPGQQMQWEIQGEPEREQQKADERQWSTEVELALPKLGDVSARLVLTGGELRLSLRTADATTANMFNRALPNLKKSLEDAGVALVNAVVEKP